MDPNNSVIKRLLCSIYIVTFYINKEEKSVTTFGAHMPDRLSLWFRFC